MAKESHIFIASYNHHLSTPQIRHDFGSLVDEILKYEDVLSVLPAVSFLNGESGECLKQLLIYFQETVSSVLW